MAVWKVPTSLVTPAKIRRALRDACGHAAASVEHCVPQCWYRKRRPQLSRDMHNTIPLPQVLNAHRSNYKLVEGIGGHGTDGWKAIRGFDGAMKHTKKGLFVPPPALRGLYARSVGYFYLLYPEYQPVIQASVLTPELILRWTAAHPARASELRMHEKKAALQGNINPLLDRSTSDDALHAIWLLMQRT